MNIKNMDPKAISVYDELDAKSEDVLLPYTFVGQSQIRTSGTMTNNRSGNTVLLCGDNIFITKGYHTGDGTVSVATLEEQTIGSVTKDRMSINKTAWVNGILITGGVPVNEYDITTPPYIGANITFRYSAPYYYFLIDYGIHKQYTSTAGIIFHNLAIDPVSSVPIVDINNIKYNYKVFSENMEAGKYTYDGTVLSTTIREGKTAYSKGQKIIGTMKVPTLY